MDAIWRITEDIAVCKQQKLSQVCSAICNNNSWRVNLYDTVCRGHMTCGCSSLCRCNTTCKQTTFTAVICPLLQKLPSAIIIEKYSSKTRVCWLTNLCALTSQGNEAMTFHRRSERKWKWFCSMCTCIVCLLFLKKGGYWDSTPVTFYMLSCGRSKMLRGINKLQVLSSLSFLANQVINPVSLI